MTVVALAPTGTGYSTGISITGAASAHAALSDSSTSSYVEFDTGTDEVLLQLADLTLPSGAVIKAVKGWTTIARTVSGSGNITLNLSASGGFDVSSNVVTITWGTPTEIRFLNAPFYTDAEVDGMTLGATAQTGAVIRLYEAYAQVTYVEQPVVSVTGPATPVTDTNLPIVTWANTLDADGGAQTTYEVRVFNSAQYGAGGFDPATSGAAADSGVQGGSTNSWQVDEILPDATYRAYVRSAQTVNDYIVGYKHWSDWDYHEFTLSVALPAVPSVDAVADAANGRVTVTVTEQSGDATTDYVEIERSTDGGTTWAPFRTLSDSTYLTLSGGSIVVYDYEMPLGESVQYRGRAHHDYSGVYAASAWGTDTVTVTTAQWWLKHPTRPDLNVPVAVFAYESGNRLARQGVFQGLGATLPIVVTDTRLSASGTVTLRTDTAADRDALDEILATLDTLLLHGPASDGEPDRYVRLGDHARARLTQRSTSPYRSETLTWVEVASPSGVVEAWP